MRTTLNRVKTSALVRVWPGEFDGQIIAVFFLVAGLIHAGDVLSQSAPSVAWMTDSDPLGNGRSGPEDTWTMSRDAASGHLRSLPGDESAWTGMPDSAGVQRPAGGQRGSPGAARETGVLSDGWSGGSQDAWRRDGVRAFDERSDGGSGLGQPAARGWQTPGSPVPGTDRPSFRFRGDPGPRGDSVPIEGSDPQYRFRPLSEGERERTGVDSTWRPLEPSPGRRGQPDLYDSMRSPNGVRSGDPYGGH